MKHISFKRLSRLWKSRAGGVLIYFAIAAPVLIGIAGASIDIGLWYANKRLVQTAADSAALAGALELRRTDEVAAAAIQADVETAVNLDAAINGYSTGNGDTIVVDTSNSPQVAVTISRPTPGLLSQVVFTEQTNVAARAVAQADVNDSCIWSLSPSGTGVTISGSAQVDLGCGVIANSSDDDGIDENGTGCLTATEIKVVGGTEGDCINPTAGTGIDPVDDPLAALDGPPGPYTCDFTNVNVTAAMSPLQPGTYCGFLRINTAAPIVFDPGLYILDQAGFDINGGANVTGTDVSFYLTANGNVSDNITFSGGATVVLSAPSDGPLPGILFYQDRNTSANITHNLTGGANMQLNGIIYFPTVDMKFTGGSTLTESASIIIANKVTFTGDVHLGGFTTAPGNAILGNALMLQATLVE
ncbi:MAG: pilus assembly protein [Proteobacteria bacterium]|nr:pilus assembly protein [Pseudomonadota bacterium]